MGLLVDCRNSGSRFRSKVQLTEAALEEIRELRRLSQQRQSRQIEQLDAEVAALRSTVAKEKIAASKWRADGAGDSKTGRD